MSLDKTLPNLYPLRFILALFVVVHHIAGISRTLDFPGFGEWPLLDRGNLAVYYFFTLSGFLIIRLIYLELKESGTFNFKKFYMRRIQRLYPVYYLVLGTGIALYHFILPALRIQKDIAYDLKSLILHYVFFIPNVFRLENKVGSILNILWSIGIEEQFYLFIPLFLFFFRKRIAKALLLLLIVFVLILIFYSSFYHYENYYYYFMAGGLAAIVFENRRVTLFQQKWFHFIIYTVFVLSFFTDIFYFPYFKLYHLFNLLISTLLLTLIAYYPIFKVKNKFFNHIGKISYGIYMYHCIVITGLLFVIGKVDINWHNYQLPFIIGFNILAIASSIVVAHFSYEYFEKLFYKQRPSIPTSSLK